MELYHVVNRGVDKRKIFLDNQDHFRFIHDLFEFNKEDRVNTTFYTFNKSNDIASRKIVPKRTPPKERKLLVDIHAFCLMPNHYHLLLSPRIHNGVSQFMKKVDMGYAKYFNNKYERKGTLFERRYKAVVVSSDIHFIHLPYYIHFNPLDLVSPEWRDKQLIDMRRAVAFLQKYRWSSYLDYIGIKNFPSVTNRDFLLVFFNGHEAYTKDMMRWLKDIHHTKDIEMIQDVLLE